MKNLKYLSYVLRHKLFVTIECFRVGLFWRGIKHDWTKFLPHEFFPYAEHFYGEWAAKNRPGGRVGYRKNEDTKDEPFEEAWESHWHRHDHHWEMWVDYDNPMVEDSEDVWGYFARPMTEEALLEMICDWRGASRAQGYGRNVIPWYMKQREKIRLHPDTRKKVEDIIEFMRPVDEGWGPDGEPYTLRRPSRLSGLERHRR